jgi:hypothetical protein
VTPPYSSTYIIAVANVLFVRLCRHGSPAPNTRPGSGLTRTAPAPSGGSGATGRQHILASSAAGRGPQATGGTGLQGSVSSLGSGIVGAGVGGTNPAAR